MSSPRRGPLPAVLGALLIPLLYPSLVLSHSLLTSPTLSPSPDPSPVALTLALPVASQLPPVAYPSTPYTFPLSPATFTFANSSPLAYASSARLTAQGMPSWLAFDEPALLFSGTPPDDAQQGSAWNVSLSPAAGGTSSPFQLFLSPSAPPALVDPLDAQLADGTASLAGASPLPDSSGVVVPPSTTFSVSFAPDIWGDPPDGGTYAFAALQAISNLPLPSWLALSSSADNVTFSGTSPSAPTSLLVSLSLLSPSSYPGSALASTNFTFQVAPSPIDLADGPGLGEIRTTVGDHVRYFFWPGGVSVGGGQAVDPGSVQAEWDLSGVPWLSYDATSRYLTGTTPDSFLLPPSLPLLIPLNLTVPSAAASPPYPTYLPLQILPYAFTSLTFPAYNSTAPTAPVNASFASYLSSPDSGTLWIEAFFSPASASSWLALDGSQTALIGTPPSNVSYPSVSVGLLAWDEQTNLTSTASLTINLQTPSPTSSASISSTTSNPTSNPKDSVSTGLSAPARNTLIAVLASLAALLLLVLVLLCICRRRRRSRQQRVLIREKGIGKPIRPMTFDPESVQAAAEAGYILAPEMRVQLPPQAVTSTGSSPTLYVTSPYSGSADHTHYYTEKDKKAGYGEYVLVDSAVLPRSPPRAHTPIEQLRARYPHAFVGAGETSPPSTAGLATDESAGGGVVVDERALREMWGVTASGSEQVRMIDRAVVQAHQQGSPMKPNAKGKGKEARRSRLMDFFGDGFFAARGNHHALTEEEEGESPGLPDLARQLSLERQAEEQGWDGREYDAFGRRIGREGEDPWGAGSEPRALFSQANVPLDTSLAELGYAMGEEGEDSVNPFGSGRTGTSLGLDGSNSNALLFSSDTDLALSHSSDGEQEEGEYTEESFPFDSNGSSGEMEVAQVGHAQVVRLPSAATAAERERWRTTNNPSVVGVLGTPRVVYAGERWTPPPTQPHMDGLPQPGSAETLGYPTFSFGEHMQHSSSMSVRLIQPPPPGPVLSPASASAARLDMSTFPTSTPARAPPPHMPPPPLPPVPTQYRPTQRRRPTSASSSPTLQPTRYLARAGDAFHFTPTLNPPPPVAPTSSRNSSIIRPSYILQPDPESDERTTVLPDWLHWDHAELKLFGQPRREDAHKAFGVRVLERVVVAPGSPTKGRSPAGSVEEQVVCRLVIEVAAPTR